MTRLVSSAPTGPPSYDTFTGPYSFPRRLSNINSSSATLLALSPSPGASPPEYSSLPSPPPRYGITDQARIIFSSAGRHLARARARALIGLPDYLDLESGWPMYRNVAIMEEVEVTEEEEEEEDADTEMLSFSPLGISSDDEDREDDERTMEDEDFEPEGLFSFPTFSLYGGGDSTWRRHPEVHELLALLAVIFFFFAVLLLIWAGTGWLGKWLTMVAEGWQEGMDVMLDI